MNPWMQLRAVAALTRARLMLRRSNTTETLRRLGSAGARPVPIEPTEALNAVRRASRMVGGKCLPQAIALTAILQRAGYEPSLVLGCRRATDASWLAHAWVRVGGLVLEPAMAKGFTPLALLNEKTGWVPSPVDAGDYR